MTVAVGSANLRKAEFASENAMLACLLDLDRRVATTSDQIHIP